MNEKEKRLALVILAIAAILLLLFWDKIRPIANRIVERADEETSPIAELIAPNITVDLPPLGYVPAQYSTINYHGAPLPSTSRGCSLCSQIGYGILIYPSEPAPTTPPVYDAVQVEQIEKRVNQFTLGWRMG